MKLTEAMSLESSSILAHVQQWLNGRAQVFQDRCERHRFMLLVVVSCVYFAVTSQLASWKPMWSDELFTLYIARLSSLSEILAALATGADQNPPSYYFLTHMFLKLMGEAPLVVRLPEVLGVFLMSLCLFYFLSNRLPTLYAIAAMTFPFTTVAFEYAYEARPYGLVLGFTSLTFLCWQRATERSRCVWWLVGLTASGAAAISSHYYAVLLLVPLGVGELVRSWSGRRVDYPIWAAMGLTLLPLLLFYPLLEAASTYSQYFWSSPKWSNIPGFYLFLLMPTLGPIVATLIVASVWGFSEESAGPSSDATTQGLLLHEIAAGIGFITIPVVAVILAKLVTGAFASRYVLMAVIGFSILIPVAIHRIQARRKMVGVCFTVFVFAWFVFTGIIQLRHQSSITNSWHKTYAFLQERNQSQLPIVAADLHSFMMIAHSAPQHLSSRIVYLADPQASIRHLGHDTVDRGILDLNPWFHVPVEKYASFMSTHSQFLIYARARGIPSWLGYYWPGHLDWIFCELSDAPVEIQLKGWDDDDLLFLVTSRVAKQTVNMSLGSPPAALGMSGGRTAPGLAQSLCRR